MELVQRNIQNHIVELEVSENFLVLLNQFVGLLNIQLVSIELVEILLILEEDTLLDLDHLRNSVVLLNLSLLILLRNKCSSPLLEKGLVRSTLNPMWDQEELEILLLLKQRKDHLIMLVLVLLNYSQENKRYISYKNLQTSHLIITLLLMNLLILVIFRIILTIPILQMELLTG